MGKNETRLLKNKTVFEASREEKKEVKTKLETKSAHGLLGSGCSSKVLNGGSKAPLPKAISLARVVSDARVFHSEGKNRLGLSSLVLPTASPSHTKLPSMILSLTVSLQVLQPEKNYNCPEASQTLLKCFLINTAQQLFPECLQCTWLLQVNQGYFIEHSSNVTGA